MGIDGDASATAHGDVTDLDYAPDVCDDPTYCGIAEGCPERCRVHNLKPTKCVAFEGTNTGRRFYLCPIKNEAMNCGFVSWVDDQEWPVTLQNESTKEKETFGYESTKEKETFGCESTMSTEESGMPKEKEVFDFESTSFSALLQVKRTLKQELTPVIYDKILIWLLKIKDEGRKISELSEFQRWIFSRWSIGTPIDIKSGIIEDLDPLVYTLSSSMSSLMVEMLAPKPTDLSFVSTLLLYSQQIDPLWEDMKTLLNSFTTEKDGADDPERSKFTDERNLICVSNLQSISEYIDVLCNLEPSLHHNLGKLVNDKEMSSIAKIVEEPVMGGEDEHKSGIVVEDLDAFRNRWELLRRPARKFGDMTLLSPMVFTHCTAGRIPRDAIVGSTLQIYSVRVAELHQVEGSDLSCPLEVYGVVAARDTVDSSRNPIFLRPRHNCQIITLQDPFLHLMGPSRAILSMDLVSIEIELKIKGKAKTEDRKLISKVCHYKCGSFAKFLVRDNNCAIELCCEQVKQSVQATVSRVRVVEQGSLSSQFVGRVLCYSLLDGAIEDATDQTNKQIVMLDSKDGTLSMGKHHCLNLSKNVVAVELKGRLKVSIEASASSGTITGNILFTPKSCSITKDVCFLGDAVVELTVAWSLLPSPKKS